MEHANNSHHCETARIWVCWSPSITVDIIENLPQHIHYKVLQNGDYLLVTICYGANSAMDRKNLWNSLINISQTISHLGIVARDFNIIRWNYEKTGGAPSDLNTMMDFNNCIDHCGLQDVSMIDSKFTWSNSSSGSSHIECKLDRMLVNPQAIQLLNFEGKCLNLGISDHHPLLLSSSSLAPPIRVPFKYFNAWARECNFFVKKLGTSML